MRSVGTMLEREGEIEKGERELENERTAVTKHVIFFHKQSKHKFRSVLVSKCISNRRIEIIAKYFFYLSLIDSSVVRIGVSTAVRHVRTFTIYIRQRVCTMPRTHSM